MSKHGASNTGILAIMTDEKRATWETYARAWKEQSRAAKAAALLDSVVPDCVYTDPLTTANGHAELIQYMLEFHQQVPGGYFVTTYFLFHHGAAISKWNMMGGNGDMLGDGVSYARFNEAGKLITMTGFFDTPKR